MPTKLIRGLLFHCRHQFSWPRSDDMGKNYQVCVHCGAMYSYDWATMRRIARLSPEASEGSARQGVRSSCGTRRNWTPRPRRLRHQVPVQFRAAGSEEWSEGMSENISRSGILIRAASPMEIGASLELTLEMPAELTGDAGARVICKASVLRIEAPPAVRSGKEPSFLIACAISDYKFASEAG